MKKFILLVEDCDMMARFLAGSLQSDYQIARTANPIEAILWLKTHPAPDAFVLDFEMPEMSGLEFVRHLKSKAETRDVPTIMLSGVKNVENRWLCLDAGANDFLAKPFHPKELALRLKNLLNKQVPSS
jgi:DNA-binding response OmpR family regulator